ncbi:MAG: hypothetical protein J7M26_00605, partial [Armatimonadetes bacterium]|nr:hypothetical protein [Armatimonadota bacterium]
CYVCEQERAEVRFMRAGICIALAVFLLAVASYGAEQCQATAGDGQQCESGQSQQNPDNLALTIKQDAVKERLETLQAWGFTGSDLLLIRRYKAQMHRLREQMEDALQELAVQMYSDAPDPQEQAEVAQKIVEKISALQQQDRQLQQELIRQIGANSNPMKMAGLMLLGAVANGRRTMCEVKPGVSGGSQGPGIPLHGFRAPGAQSAVAGAGQGRWRRPGRPPRFWWRPPAGGIAASQGGDQTTQ